MWASYIFVALEINILYRNVCTVNLGYTGLGYNGWSFNSPAVSLCFIIHCNYLGYTGLLYIGSSVTSNFSDIPQQLTSLVYTVFGKIMAISQRLQFVRAQGAHKSERHEDCKCNLIAFSTGDAVETCTFCTLLVFAKDKV
jgi:hypothetical protein